MGQPPGLLVVCSQTPAEMLLGSSQRVPTKRPCVSDCSFTGYIWIPRNPSVVLSFHRGTRFSERTAKETKKQISFQPLPCPHLVPSWEMKAWSCQLSHAMPHPVLSHPRGSAQEAGSRAYLSPPLLQLGPSAQPGNHCPGRKPCPHSSAVSSQIFCPCPSDPSPNGLGGFLKNKRQEVTAFILFSGLILLLFQESRDIFNWGEERNKEKVGEGMEKK